MFNGIFTNLSISFTYLKIEWYHGKTAKENKMKNLCKNTCDVYGTITILAISVDIFEAANGTDALISGRKPLGHDIGWSKVGD